MVHPNDTIVWLRHVAPVFCVPAVLGGCGRYHATGIGAAKVWVVVEAELQARVVECSLPVRHDEQGHDCRDDAKYRDHDVVHSCPLDQKPVFF